MEKYSAYRDPGTGIQPFLPPVPPQGSTNIAFLTTPISYVLGFFRTSTLVFVGIVYLILQGLLRLLSPIAPLYNALSYVVTVILARFSLLLVGVYWINVEIVKRKRGRGAVKENWIPKAGDVIVSNWISWLELVWLSFRFNPLFILPVTSVPEAPAISSSPRTTPGRKTGTGSAAISLPHQSRQPAKRAEIFGFREISLLGMITSCGHIPPYGSQQTVDAPYKTFEEAQNWAKKNGRPLVIFPECTTSNGRGLLRFANVFKGVAVPVNTFNIFVMCVRIEAPTALSPTVSLSIPSTRLNPLSHIFSISSSILPHTLSIRLLALSESPSSGTFVVSDVLNSGISGPDDLSEVCATLMSDIGRLKRTGMGWEDKASFFDFYEKKIGR